MPTLEFSRGAEALSHLSKGEVNMIDKLNKFLLEKGITWDSVVTVYDSLNEHPDDIEPVEGQYSLPDARGHTGSVLLNALMAHMDVPTYICSTGTLLHNRYDVMNVHVEKEIADFDYKDLICYNKKEPTEFDYSVTDVDEVYHHAITLEPLYNSIRRHLVTKGTVPYHGVELELLKSPLTNIVLKGLGSQMNNLVRWTSNTDEMYRFFIESTGVPLEKSVWDSIARHYSYEVETEDSLELLWTMCGYVAVAHGKELILSSLVNTTLLGQSPLTDPRRERGPSSCLHHFVRKPVPTDLAEKLTDAPLVDLNKVKNIMRLISNV